MKIDELVRLLNDPTKEEMRRYDGGYKGKVTTDFIRSVVKKELSIDAHSCFEHGDNRCLDANTAKELIEKVAELED